MSRQVAKVGDVFWVSIDDGSFVFGQVVEIKKEVLNSITCAFFDLRIKNIDENDQARDLSNPISVQFVTKDLFNNSTWKYVKNEAVIIPETILPYRETEKAGWVGAKVIGSGLIVMFLSAFYGLRPWDEMNDPEYYQKLLLPGILYHSKA